MIIRDGRNVRHDLGAKPASGNALGSLATMFRPMRGGETWMTTKSRGFFDRDPDKKPRKTHADHNRAYRERDLDQAREKERIRCRRYRQGATYKARRAAMKKNRP